MKWLVLCVSAATAAALAACYDSPSRPDEPPGAPLTPVASLPGHEGLGVDTTPKQRARTLPGEAYLRTYQMLFGGISPQEIARDAKGSDGTALFETWSSALGALGLPDYAADIDRSSDTNALMLASYERLGIALCDRAVEHDLRGGSPARIFDFAPSKDPKDHPAFDDGFNHLHRTFLGYPATLAPGRSERFYALYTEVVTRHGAAGAPKSVFSPIEAGWAVVCYGLVRHPEFHLY